MLDTSESTSGDLVKAFLRETFTLLKSTDSFFAKCRILVMQCDDAVRSETFLSDLNELDQYTRSFVLQGGGGTDFRPAFARIARAARRKQNCASCRGCCILPTEKGPIRPSGSPMMWHFCFWTPGTRRRRFRHGPCALVIEPEELIQPKAPSLPLDLEQNELDELPEL